MNSEKDLPLLMTMADACVFLNVSRRTVLRMVAAEALPEPKTLKNFRQRYFQRAEFLKHVAKGLK
ncbi:helix-turn-helix domain-containing protein [Ramlibacter terrae]|uniref:Helix-turn-helix domain-containing protein n=1 Tax=Ramlibacter terrae TaxID=2732511 RepID=A0ABX6P781_9BURK|nr:helix-turn-helix domain-containing protein [Ramlibacter terrae]